MRSHLSHDNQKGLLNSITIAVRSFNDELCKVEIDQKLLLDSGLPHAVNMLTLTVIDKSTIDGGYDARDI